MDRVYLGAPVTLRCEETEATVNPWRLNDGSTQRNTPIWISYCRGGDHNPSATNRAANEQCFAHRSWTDPHFLIKGYFHDKSFALTVTGYGQHDLDRKRSDLQSLMQPYLDPQSLIAIKGENEVDWPEMTARAEAIMNTDPFPVGRSRSGSDLVTESPGEKRTRTSGLESNKARSEPKAIESKKWMIGDRTTPDLENNHRNQGLIKADPSYMKQIFIRSVEGKHCCVQIKEGMDVQELKKQIHNKLGIPATYQSLLFSRSCMQDQHTLQHYRVVKDSTIILNLGLRGGCKGTSSKNSGSFRDAVKGKEPMQHRPASTPELPGPYIVEQKPEAPILTVSLPEVTDLYSDLTHNAVICRFNGYWPKADALHQWIYTSWTTNCEIYLCPKGFFIVIFSTELERDNTINQGPWFWGNAGLFLTPWFPDFDANTIVVSTMPVWVRLHNLPLHFWHRKALTAIGNSLGKHIKIDEDRANRGIFTYAKICVEVDLSQGLPDHITLNFNNSLWTQQLDYENTTFRCHSCLQTGHLQNACPLTCKEPKGNKKQQKRPKGWQHTEPLEEEALNTEPTDIYGRQEKMQEENIEGPKLEPNSMIRQQEPQLEISGAKRAHSTKGSDSDKEQPGHIEENQLAIIVPTANAGVWRKVEKKKGRKI